MIICNQLIERDREKEPERERERDKRFSSTILKGFFSIVIESIYA